MKMEMDGMGWDRLGLDGTERVVTGWGPGGAVILE
jgi:hypothetical protein